MTVETTTNTQVARGNGATTSWPFNFKVLDATHLVIQRRVFATGVIDKTYSLSEVTVTGVGDVAGGTVEITPALSDTYEVIISRTVPYKQELDIVNQGGFFPDTVEQQLDLLEMQIQQISDKADRAIIVPKGETGGSLPIKTLRANKFAAYDSAGDPSVADGAAPVPNTAVNIIGIAIPVSSRSLLKAIDTSRQIDAFLCEGDRFGYFRFDTTDHSADVSADTEEGLFIAPTADATGASGAWVRQWDGIHGKPEWFGAIANSGGADALAANNAALAACVSLCPVTILAAADYYISTTWKVLTQYRTVRGSGFSDGYNTGNGTRIICTDATKDVMQVGPDAYPGTPSDCYRNIYVSNLALAHSTSLTAPSDRSTAVAGLRAQYLFDCRIDRIYSWEELVGVRAYGTVATYFTRCKMLRTVAQGGSDFAYAFWARGVAPSGETIFGNGGNLSLYVEDGNGQFNGALAIDRIGFYADGDAGDTYVRGFETSSASHGIVLDLAPTVTYGAQDIRIVDCLCDQCSDHAILISGLNGAGTVTISGGYYQANPGPTEGSIIYIADGAGSVALTGGMQIACGSDGDLRGVHVHIHPNVTIDESVQITDCPYGVVLDGDSDRGRVTCTIKNANIGDGSKYAVFIDAVTQGLVAPLVTGKAGAYADAIHCNGSANDKFVIDPTRVDPTCCTNKLTINGTAITVPGSYTSSGASGTSGQGISVVGITV